MPELSVIIPCFNVKEHYIKECISSILNQTYQNFEVILVDDGSNELFAKILEELLTLDGRIGLYKQANLGVSVARNNGVKNSQGEYICFIDADDRIFPNYFEQAMSIIKEKDADILYSYVYRRTNNRDIEPSSNYVEVKKINQEWIKKYTIGSYYINKDKFFGRGPWARILKKNIAEINPFLVGVPIGEDILWNLNILEKINCGYIADTIWYIYEEREDSATNKFCPNILDKLYPFYKNIQKYIKTDKDKIFYYDRVLNDLRRYIFQLYLGHKDNNDSFIIRWKKFEDICKCWPWSCILNKKYIKASSMKTKLKLLLIRSHLMFAAWTIKHK